MTTPICDPSDLGVYLGVSVDEVRATMLLADAQALCESILTPLPDAAAAIVRRIAARAYTNISSTHTATLGPATIGYGSPNATIGVGGLYLSQSDKRDLRRLAGGGGAFTIDTLAADYAPCVPWWDEGSWLFGDEQAFDV